ncbi:MAG: inositol monophosphatase family protein [Candidatus Microbacterium stercoravium]
MSAPRIVAHRGRHGAESIRENTIAAIRAAAEAGAGAIEIDVRLTADGEVVLLHDATLERLWGDARTVSEMTWTQLRRVGGGDARIPSLAEALEIAAECGAVLVIAMDHAAPARPAARIVRGAGAQSRTEWCGATDAMLTVRDELPDAVIHQEWHSPDAPDHAALDALRPAYVNAQHLLVGARFVDAVHALGARVACWTVDDPAQAAHLANLGVDSITTNDLEAVAVAAPDAAARCSHVVREIAVGAAEILARAQADGIGEVMTKTGPADHVTEVDRAVERWVRGIIGAQFPDHDVVGEEYGGSTDGSVPCWYLDPVDGTANLANGVPWTSFSLALVIDGEPVVGAILDPVGGRPIVAMRGGGAWRDGQRLVASPSRGDALAGRIVTTELAGADPWRGFAGVLKALAARHCTVRVPGSGTASLAGPALGRGAAAVVHRYHAIDHAASVLIVREAGGAVRLRSDGVVITAVDALTAAALEEIVARARAGQTAPTASAASRIV